MWLATENFRNGGQRPLGMSLSDYSTSQALSSLENKLEDEEGKEVQLKQGDRVDVTFEAGKRTRKMPAKAMERD